MQIIRTLFMLIIFIIAVIGLIGCSINNGMTMGFLAFPYSLMLAKAYSYKIKNGIPFSKVFWISYLACIVVNPLGSRLFMEGQANEKFYQLVFIKDAFVVREEFIIQPQYSHYGVSTQSQIDYYSKELSESIVIHKVQAFKKGDIFPYPFERDLTSWIDGERYKLNMKAYSPKEEDFILSFGGLKMDSSPEERIFELYKGNQIYTRSIGFYLSQAANWPAGAGAVYSIVQTIGLYPIYHGLSILNSEKP